MVVPSVLWRESPSSNVMQAPRVVCEIRATNVGILRQSEKRREDTLTASGAPSSAVHYRGFHTDASCVRRGQAAPCLYRLGVLL